MRDVAQQGFPLAHLEHEEPPMAQDSLRGERAGRSCS